MKHRYSIPSVQILKLSVEDVVRTSEVTRIEALFNVGKEDSMNVKNLFD